VTEDDDGSYDEEQSEDVEAESINDRRRELPLTAQLLPLIRRILIGFHPRLQFLQRAAVNAFSGASSQRNARNELSKWRIDASSSQ